MSAVFSIRFNCGRLAVDYDWLLEEGWALYMVRCCVDVLRRALTRNSKDRTSCAAALRVWGRSCSAEA